MNPLYKLDRFRKTVIRPTQPPDTFTVSDYAKRYRITRGTANDELTKLMTLGKVEIVGYSGRGTKWYKLTDFPVPRRRK